MNTTLQAKPTRLTAEEYFICNDDKPTNAEVLAEYIYNLEYLLTNPAKISESLPSWVSLSDHLDFMAERIAAITI